MKKIFILISFLISLVASSQTTYPVQTIGAPNNIVVARGLLGFDTAVVFRTNWTDTAAANLSPKLRFQAGAQIRVGDDIWQRRNNLTAWFRTGAGSVIVDTTTSVILSGTGSVDDPIVANAIISTDNGNVAEVRANGIYVPNQLADGLNQGGVVVWSGSGYTYDVSPAFFTIAGIQYTAPETQVTLSNADPTFNRFDIVVANKDGTITVVTGTPALNPLFPTLDQETQVSLRVILVTANTTEPVVELANIYINNAEWTTASSTARINPASTNNPYSPTLDVEGTDVQNLDNIRYTAVTPITISNYNVLTFKVYSKALWLNTSTITMQWFDASVTATGLAVQLANNAYGFNSAQTSSYQTISIPLTEFGNLVNPTNLLMTVTTIGGATIGFYIDNIQLQESFVPTGTGSFINNQNTVIQPTANFIISGRGIVGNVADIGGAYTLQSGGEAWINGVAFGHGIAQLSNSIRAAGTVGGPLSVVIGFGASSTGTSTTIVGASSTTAVVNTSIFGYNNTVTGPSGIAVGLNNTGVGGITIGHTNTGSSALAIVIGSNQTGVVNYDIIFGYNTVGTRPQNFYPGGAKSVNPGTGGALFDINYRGVSASGTNQLGQTITFNAGASTGNIAGGSIIFRTAPAGASGSTVGTLADRLTILSTGQQKWGAYGVGTFTGSVAYIIAVDASGNLIETTTSGINPTWQQALTTGSTLTGNNTITGGSFTFTMNATNLVVNSAVSNNFTLQNGGNDIVLATNTSTDKVIFSNTRPQATLYGSGAITGTPTFGLAVDASGNFIEVAIGTGMTNPMTTTGDIIYSTNGSGTPGRLGIGTAGQVLTVSGGLPIWVTPGVGGSVTSVGWTGGIVSIANPSTTPAFTIAGISGGGVYFSSTSTWASTALLAANAIMIGGGAGSAYSTTTTGSGILTWVGTPSSANLATALTDETGSGTVVFSTSPTLVTPALGTPSALVGTNITGTGASFTSGITLALKSASTTVDVSASTAPTTGQVLVATSSTTATWQTLSPVSGVASATGVANRVLVNGTTGSAQTGAIVLSLPQDIATGSAVRFGFLGIGGAAGSANPVIFDPTATPNASTNSYVVTVQGTITENTSGTHGLLAGLYVQAPTVTAGAATVTNAATLVVASAPSVTVTGLTDAVLVSSGTVRITDLAQANTYATLDANGRLTKGFNRTIQTLTDGLSVTWNVTSGGNAQLTLGGTGRTLSISNPVIGETYTIEITQGSGGSKTITTWPTNTTFSGSNTLSTTAGDVDIAVFYYNGSGFRCVLTTDYD